MTGLVADRFLFAGRQWMDLATGLGVSLHVEPAGCRDEEFAWSLRCETLANLRHELLNPLVDFGAIDRARRFEAYTRRGPLRASGRTAARIVRHAMRFLRAHDVAVESPLGAFALRPLVSGPAPRIDPVGLVLQRRGTYEALLETLDVAHPAGVSHVAVVGPPQSGLRTLWLLVARAARQQGYVPVAGDVLATVSGIAELLIDRHVCVFGNGAASREVAAFLAKIGAASARRHLLIEFVRRHDGRALRMDRMGVGTMTAMVHVDDEFGPAPDAIFDAARRADGRPGLFVARLAGAAPDDVGATASVARETAPAYGVARSGPAASGRVSGVLVRAGARAERLARSGRHAAAARLLSRAVRVLAARRGREQAADAALRLGGLALDRGMPARALSAFNEARDLASSTVPRISAAIGAG